MGTISNLTQTKFLQHLRSNILSSKKDAIDALNTLASMLESKQGVDGTIVLTRYTDEKNDVKSLIGVFAGGVESSKSAMTIYSQDMAAFAELEKKVTENAKAITAETQNRENADTLLNNAITAETQARENADTLLNNAITAETQARENAVITLEGKITKAKTEVKESSEDSSHLEVTNSTHSDGHTIYEIKLTDVASAKGLADEISRSTNLDNKIIKSVGLTALGDHNSQTGAEIISAATTIAGETLALNDAITAETSTRTSEIARVEGLVTAEKKRAEGIENQLRADLGTTEQAAKGNAFTRIESLESSLGEGGSVSKQIDDKIKTLDKLDSPEDGQYVASVNEEDGIITVTKKVMVNPSDNVLQWNENGINSTIEIVKLLKPSDATVKEEFQLQGLNGIKLGESIKIYKDSALSNVEIKKACPGAFTGGTEPCEPEAQVECLCLTYFNSVGEEIQANIDLGLILSESEFKDGLQVLDGIVSVKKHAESEDANFLTVDANGVGLVGITNAIIAAKNEAKTLISTKDGGHVKVSSSTSEDGHLTYTITEENIASETALTAEVDARKAVTGIQGDEYVKHEGDAVISEAINLDDADKLLSAAITTANSQIATNTSDLEKIKGDKLTPGSIAKAVEDAKTELKGDVSGTNDTLGKLEDSLEAEVTRATNAEKAINDSIGKKDVTGDTVYGAIKAEENRALGVEEQLRTDLTSETTARRLIVGQGEVDTYQPNSVEGVTYIKDASSLNDADIKLDKQIKANADKIATLESGRLSGIKGGNGIEITGDTNTEKTISVKLDSVKTDNALSNSKNGLYLSNIWDCGTFEYNI